MDLSNPPAAEVGYSSKEVLGDHRLHWLIEYSRVLQSTRLDLVRSSRAELAFNVLGQIEYGGGI